jgi:hypothetical protein
MQEPCALYSTVQDANIRSPKEMEGRSIGGPPGDTKAEVTSSMSGAPVSRLSRV